MVSIYGGEIKVYPQYEISGSHGKGPVDLGYKDRDSNNSPKNPIWNDEEQDDDQNNVSEVQDYK